MSLAVEKAEFFKQDYASQFLWYVDEAGPDLARRFQASLDQTLNKLARQPDLGRLSRIHSIETTDEHRWTQIRQAESG